MTAALKQLFETFDALSDAERQQATRELLRRALQNAPAEVCDEDLVMAAEELFLELDAREAVDGKS